LLRKGRKTSGDYFILPQLVQTSSVSSAMNSAPVLTPAAGLLTAISRYNRFVTLSVTHAVFSPRPDPQTSWISCDHDERRLCWVLMARPNKVTRGQAVPLPTTRRNGWTTVPDEKQVHAQVAGPQCCCVLHGRTNTSHRVVYKHQDELLVTDSLNWWLNASAANDGGAVLHHQQLVDSGASLHGNMIFPFLLPKKSPPTAHTHSPRKQKSELMLMRRATAPV